MEPCRRPGCGGHIEDGYCTECGLAPEGAPTSLTTATEGSGASSSRGTRSLAITSSRRRSSGVAFSALPPIPPRDPMAALVPGEVPERKRFCSSCGSKLSRQAGFCPKCGQQYSFEPSLRPGQVISGKYEIKGTMAFGGLGWIYLAMDTVLNRWIVLKGLLNTMDPAMVRVAVQEREFLAAVKHPNIVSIYDFITEGSEGFIVMEYVNGKSLLQLRREGGAPMPALNACSYVLELLPAFTYLHQMGLVYCDFKIDNAIVEDESVKLIDMGAVRRLDDQGGDVYGTRGYAAPEAGDDPTPVSDLYTVGRALAVLVADFDFQRTMEHALPSAEAAPAFAQHPSLHRFLLKATRADPGARFQSAEEMAGQLQGVLRDITAGTGVLAHVDSSIFEGETTSGQLQSDTGLAGSQTTVLTTRFRQLPGLRAAGDDPAAPAIAAASLMPDARRRLALLEQAWASHPESLELPFQLAGAHIDASSPDADVESWLTRAEGVASDWRVHWYRGQAALAQGDPAAARNAFEAVLDELPGELAPKLALAYAQELGGDLAAAAAGFELVSKADPSYTSAAFGLARCRRAGGDREGAIEALARVPPTSSRYQAAQMAMAEVLIGEQPAPPGEGELRRAADVVDQLRTSVDGIPLHRLTARLLLAAAGLVEDGRPAGRGEPLLGIPLRGRRLRAGAERELRACARLAATRPERIRFVDEANRARPLSFV